MKLSVWEVVVACGGEWLNQEGALDTFVGKISTDTRDITEGSLFVPLVGPHYDAHLFLPEAVKKGACCALTEKTEKELGFSLPIPLIKVPSTYQALLDLASYHRRRNKARVVAVTGSAGKTTTKDMLASVLSQRYKTKKNPSNWNNAVGMSHTLFSLEPADEVIVLEMGMNHAGEIAALSRAARPDIALITNIGDSHIEHLGSRAGILRAKLEIANGLDPNGTLILNGEDETVKAHSAFLPPVRQILYCGADSDIFATEITAMGLSGTRCRIHINGASFMVQIPYPGAHMVLNSLMAAAAGAVLGVMPEEIAEGIASFTPSSNRMEYIHTNGMILINDVYNANPASVKAQVSALASPSVTAERKVCLLGDMFELGKWSERLHYETGVCIARLGIDTLICIGALAQYIRDGFFASGGKNVCYFPDKEGFLKEWRQILKPGDTVLVKASRGMAFEKIIEALRE